MRCAEAHIAPTIKSIGWLWFGIRHVSRIYQIADLTGTQALWVRDGWNQRFAFRFNGNVRRLEAYPGEAAKVMIRDAALLQDYLAASTKQ